METIEDFDKWLKEYKPPVTQYVAVFDPITNQVISVGPDHAFADQKHVVQISQEIAESIITAEIQIHNCRIDVESGQLAIAEKKTLNKLDDMLHRIPDIKYLEESKSDIHLTYSSKNKYLKIQLSTEYGGTKKYKGSDGKRKFIWDGSTDMDFLITDYNDPNLIFQMVSVKISDLVEHNVTIKNIDYGRFSVYTRRLFKNYVIEYK
jgi:hypothetical protein